MPRKAAVSFEESAKRLEEIIGVIEDCDAPLDKAIELYAEGAAIVSDCVKRLSAARERVFVISRDITGTGITEKPYSDSDAFIIEGEEDA